MVPKDGWVVHKCPPEERENAKIQSSQWKVGLRTSVRIIYIACALNILIFNFTKVRLHVM